MLFPPWDRSNPTADAARFRLTANWITASRLPFLIPMVVCFVTDHWWMGFAFNLATIAPDSVDGPWARHQKVKYASPTTVRLNRLGKPGLQDDEIDEASLSWLQIMNYPGQTAYGAWLDPLADKLANVLGLWLAGHDLVPWWLLALITLLEINLQFGVRYLKWYHGIDKPDANSYGKFKTWAEAILVGILVFYQKDYLTAVEPLSPALILCIGLAMASTYKHLQPWWRKSSTNSSPVSTQA